MNTINEKALEIIAKKISEAENGTLNIDEWFDVENKEYNVVCKCHIYKEYERDVNDGSIDLACNNSYCFNVSVSDADGNEVGSVSMRDVEELLNE